MVKTGVESCLMAFLVFWLSEAQADLGDNLDEAAARAGTYEAEFGAVAPLFKTDANGKVIWECWAAPPELWTKDQAINFSRRLIPKDMASISPKIGAKDGPYEPHVYPDGTVVILNNAGVVLRGASGSYIGVEVRSPGFDGGRC